MSSPAWNPFGSLASQAKLSTFVQERLGLIQDLLTEAEKRPCIRSKYDERGAFEGPSDPKRTHSQVQAIFETIQARKIGYRAEPPPEWPEEQAIRLPEELLSSKDARGTCIDLVILMASAVYAARIRPLIVVLGSKGEPPSHAIMGYWLDDRSAFSNGGSLLPVLTSNDLKENRGFVGFLDCIPLTETATPDSFKLAKVKAENLFEGQLQVFVAVDVHACRWMYVGARTPIDSSMPVLEGVVPPVFPGPFVDRRGESNALRRSLRTNNHVVLKGEDGVGKTALISCFVFDLLRSPKCSPECEVKAVIWISGAREYSRWVMILVEGLCRIFGIDHAAFVRSCWADSNLAPHEKFVHIFARLRGFGRVLLIFDDVDHALERGDPTLSAFLEACCGFGNNPLQLIASAQTLVAPLHNLSIKILKVESLEKEAALRLLRSAVKSQAALIHDKGDDALQSVVEEYRCMPGALVDYARKLAQEQHSAERDPSMPHTDSARSWASRHAKLLQVLSVFDDAVPVLAVEHLLSLEGRGAGVGAMLNLASQRLEIQKLDGRYAPKADRKKHYRSIPEANGSSFFDAEKVVSAVVWLYRTSSRASPTIARFVLRFALGWSKQYLHFAAAEYFHLDDELKCSPRNSPADLDNKLREFHHLLASGCVKNAFETLEEIDMPCLWKWGYYLEVVGLRRQLHDRLQAYPMLRQVNAGNLGFMYWTIGELKQAEDLLAEAIGLAKKQLDVRSCVWRNNLGLVYAATGDFGAAIEQHELAVDEARKSSRYLGLCLGDCSVSYRCVGRLQDAVRLCLESIGFSNKEQDLRVLCNQMANLACCHLLQGDIDAAKKTYQMGLELAQQHDYGLGIYFHSLGLAHCLLLGRDLNLDQIDSHLEASEAQNFPVGCFVLPRFRGVWLVQKGKLNEARDTWRNALAHAEAALIKQPQSHVAGWAQCLLQFALSKPGAINTLETLLERSHYGEFLGCD